MTNSAKRNVRALVHIAQKKGITHVVFSPGSRNAPLVIGFGNNSNFECFVVPDERSAGFVALGIAQSTGKPVLLCCTSGTASVNYYPAIAEAFYQHVPIVAITADRPAEWIDQGDGQTIRQRGVFANHIVYQADLYKDGYDMDAFQSNQRNINEALNAAVIKNGPVHINMPFEEPLYETTDAETEVFRNIDVIAPSYIAPTSWQWFVERWNKAKSKLVLIGQMQPNSSLEPFLQKIADDDSVLVMLESTGNMHIKSAVAGIDRLIDTLNTEEKSAFNPKILLTFGDAIVSKKVKVMLRHSGIQEHWHVAENLPHADTYQKLTASILAKPAVFLAYLAQKMVKATSNFGVSWQKIDAIRKERHAKYLQTTPFSDLKVFEILLKQLPENSVLQLANSSVIRYVQLFDDGRHVPHYSNRGAAGIDGSTSTAVGFALCTTKSVFLISGDISFFYDSNAFFHQHMPKNLKIIVVNNAGGNIFTIIPGPKTTGKSSMFFEAPQQASIKLLSQTYGLDYLFADDEQQLNLQIEKLKNSDKATVLEIKTPGEINSDILNNYFKFLKNGTTQLD